MIKKILSAILLFCIINVSLMPVMAKEDESTDTTIDAVFITELNVNKASKGQVVQFRTDKSYNINGFTIPKGTIFSGKIKRYKKGRWGYRRAKAIIVIDKMTLPNEKTFRIKARTKKHVLKGSAAKNTLKGVVTFPVAIAVGTVGVCVILVEAVSIVGILAIGPTSYLFGETMGKLTHGINYKKQQGDEIKLKINSIKNNSSQTRNTNEAFEDNENN